MGPKAPAAGSPVRDGLDPDHELVRQVAQGSGAALASLYERHAPSVNRVALSVTRDPGVADEVVQETFLALWNAADAYDPALGSLGGWLSRIARNRGVDRLRAETRRGRAAPFSALSAGAPDEASTAEWLVASGCLVGAGSPEPGPELAVALGETSATVATALGGLTGTERQAILLAFRDGLTHSEIATHLGWPLGTVKTRSRRALRRLREALGPVSPESVGPVRGSRSASVPPQQCGMSC